MIGLPEAFSGIIYDTASISTLHAIAAAREGLDLRVREDGMSGRGTCRYCASTHPNRPTRRSRSASSRSASASVLAQDSH